MIKAIDIGKRVWHRVFGWCTITHPYTDQGNTLVNSEHKHIKQYVMGQGMGGIYWYRPEWKY